MLREWGQVRGGGNQSEGMSLTDHEAESWRPMSGTDPPPPPRTLTAPLTNYAPRCRGRRKSWEKHLDQDE